MSEPSDLRVMSGGRATDCSTAAGGAMSTLKENLARRLTEKIFYLGRG